MAVGTRLTHPCSPHAHLIQRTSATTSMVGREPKNTDENVSEGVVLLMDGVHEVSSESSDSRLIQVT